MSRFLRLCPAAFLLAVLALAPACSDEKEAFVKPVVPVEVLVVRTSAPVRQLQAYSASLKPTEHVKTAFKVEGYVASITKKRGPDGKLRILQKGDAVAKGEALAKLRDDDYRAAVNVAKSQVEEARSMLVEAEADYKRYRAIFEKKVISRSEFDKAKEHFETNKARMAAAEARLIEVGLRLRDTVLRSPIDGLVSQRFINVGSFVQPGVEAVDLVNLDRMKAVFGLPDQILSKVRTGDTLPVAVEGLGRTFKGLVTSISPSADPQSRVFDVEVALDNPDKSLRDGMVARVELKEDVAEPSGGAESVMLPLDAVVRPPGKTTGYYAYVVREANGTATVVGRPIQVGGVYGNKVSVVGGLAPGDKVVTVGATIVSEGRQVEIIK